MNRKMKDEKKILARKCLNVENMSEGIDNTETERKIQKLYVEKYRGRKM